VNVDRFEKLQRLFLEASELPPAERNAWLESQCDDDLALADELREMLRFHERRDTPLDAGAAHTAAYREALVEYAGGKDAAPPSIPGYRVLREIARGGQAAVYEGIQISTSQRVAMKVLLGAEFSSGAEKERQDREVRVLAKLQHPHIVGIIDRGCTDSGLAFVVLPYVEGRPLDDHLHFLERTQKDGNYLPTVLPLFVKIARAVGVAHRCGVVHRDLKPSNVIIDQHGEPRILDFGLARILSPSSDDEHTAPPADVTVTGSFVGSLAWASPEQVAGNSRLIGPHTDVYALGVIMFQMLTGGQFPYVVVGSIRDVMDNILFAAPKPPSDACRRVVPSEPVGAIHHSTIVGTRSAQLNPELDAIVLKALAKSPIDRYVDANAFAEDIENYLCGRPTTAKPRDASKRPVVVSRSRRGVLLGVGLGAAAVVGAVSFLVSTPSVPVAREGQSASRPESISRAALVSAPARIPGVRSWTIETKRPRDTNQLIWDPKGRFVATAGWRDGAIRIHDLPTFETTRILVGHGTTHLRTKISPDGEFLAARGALPRLMVWETASGRLLWTADCDNAFTFSADGRILVRNRNNWGLRNSKTGAAAPWPGDQTLFRETIARPGQPDFSPDGEILAVPEFDDKIHLIDWKSGKLLQTMTGPMGDGHDFNVQFSPDGSKLYSWIFDSIICIWDVKKRQFLRVLEMAAKNDSADAFAKEPITSTNRPAWIDGGKTIVAIPFDGLPTLFDVETGDAGWTIPQGGSVDRCADDGAVGVSNDNGVYLIDVESQKLKQVIRAYKQAYILRSAISQAKNLLAFAGYDGQLLVWRLDKDARPTSVRTGLSRACEFLDVSADGKMILVGEREGGASLVDASLLGTDETAARPLLPESSGLRAVRLSENGQLAFLVNGQSVLKIVEAKSGVIAKEIPIDFVLTAYESDQTDQRANVLAPSFDGRLVAMAGKSREENAKSTVTLIECATGKKISRFVLEDDDSAPAKALAFSPRDDELAWMNSAGRITVCNYRTQEMKKYWHRPNEDDIDNWREYKWRVAIMWSHDGSRLTTIRGNTAVTWNCETHTSLQTDVRHLMATGGDRLPAIGGYGTTAIDHSGVRARIWDTRSGEAISTMFLGDDQWLVVSPEGHYASSEGIAEELAYVVEEDDGDWLTLSPEEFSRRYDWRNNPSKAIPRLSQSASSPASAGGSLVAGRPHPQNQAKIP
jgi:serine/threonine protein kinase/WD40 repeat protein